MSDSGRHRPQAKAAVRVAARPWDATTNPRRPPRPWLWPLIRGIGEHCMVAGPIFGLLSALYAYHLSVTAPIVADVATHAVIREIAWSHRRFDHAYFITPAQNTLEWALAVPAVLWLIGLVLTLVVLGMRSHHQRRK